MGMDTLTCGHCKQDKPDAEFHSAKLNVGRRGRTSWCRLCTNEQNRDRKRRQRKAGTLPGVQTAEYHRNYYRESRIQAVAALGGICVRCGIDDVQVLQIDHVEGDGYKRRVKGFGGGASYSEIRAIVRGDGRERYQLLCANCHVKKTRENNEHLSLDKRSASC